MKLRVIFDVSAKTTTGFSLHGGPDTARRPIQHSDTVPILQGCVVGRRFQNVPSGWSRPQRQGLHATPLALQ